MVRFLPPECLWTIFKYFEDDKKTLHSCLLVNRAWSSCAVSLLWRHPFELSARPSSKLIETYSKFFDSESRETLFLHRILTKRTNKPIIFDYPQYIRSLRYNSLYDFSSEWLREGQTKGNQRYFLGFETTNMLRVFVKELIKLFFKRNHSIFNLSLNVIMFLEAPDMSGCRSVSRVRPIRDTSYVNRALEYVSPFGEDLVEILSREDSGNSLNNLQTLELGANKYDIAIMNVFKNSVKTFDSLKFNFTPVLDNDESEISNAMENLIEEQVCLRKFSMRHGSRHIPSLIRALGLHVYNLTELSFDKIDFGLFQSPETLFSTISLCENLEKLIVSDCQGISNTIISPLDDATFRKLEILIFTKVHNPIDDIFRAVLAGRPPNQPVRASLEPLANVISSTNGKIKVLLLGRNLLCSREVPREFVIPATYPPESVMDATSFVCHNLTIFEIHIRSDILSPIFTILDSSFLLERFMFSAELDLIDNEEFWINISDALPIDLKDLTISIGPIFWLEVLHWLFENMRCKLEILQFPLSVFIDDEYLSLIAQYAKALGSTIEILALSSNNRVTRKGLSYALLAIENITNTGEYNSNARYFPEKLN